MRLRTRLVGLAASALLVGTALAIHGLQRAQQSAAIARVEAAKAAQVSDFVRGILAGIDPDRARSMDRSLMRLVLDSAAERAGRELAGQPAVRASIERTIADSYASLGELALGHLPVLETQPADLVGDRRAHQAPRRNMTICAADTARAAITTPSNAKFIRSIDPWPRCPGTKRPSTQAIST